jgi:F-type H+-transporting ATPase subunit b
MTIDWWTFFLQTVNFLLLVWLLQHFLYKPVKAVIERRRQLAEQALLKAEATEKEAATAKAEFEAKSAELERNREASAKAAQKAAAADAKTIIAQARKEADQIEAKARKVAEDTHSAALANLKQEIVETAVKVAETILRKTANSDLNEVFLSHILDEIDALNKDDRARIDADIASKDGAVEVATSMQLTETERETWTKTLSQHLHLRGRPGFTTEPDLLGGAELRFRHATVRFAWSDQLKKAADILAKSEPQGMKVD